MEQQKPKKPLMQNGIAYREIGMGWQDVYTIAEIQTIYETWKDMPPEQCTGKCNIINQHTATICTGCGWDDL